eukprot:6430824-Pyramimonas_sp.AAC.1
MGRESSGALVKYGVWQGSSTSLPAVTKVDGLPPAPSITVKNRGGTVRGRGLFSKENGLVH